MGARNRHLNVVVFVSLALWPSHPEASMSTLQEQNSVFIQTKEEESRWLPLGNIQNEGQRGERYRLEVHWNSPNFSDEAKTKISVELQNVTAWRGIAGNFGMNPNPDLRIEPELNDQWDVAPGGQSAKTKEELRKNERRELVVSTFDFGASCYAIARPELYYLGDSPPLDIPKDSDHDGLPDVYEDMFLFTLRKGSPDSDGDGILDALEDDDDIFIARNPSGPATPAGAMTDLGISGDGLTHWEEYRGFILQRQHLRTNWKAKDLFYTGGFQDQAMYALIRSQHPSNSHFHQFDEFSGPGERLINENNLARAGVTRQRSLAIYAANGGLPGVLGETFNSTPPSGDALPAISTGPNGICETEGRRDDNQLVAVGAVAPPNTPCVDTGNDGKSDSQANNLVPGGDDVQLLGPGFVSMTPNETEKIEIYFNQINARIRWERDFVPAVQLTIAHEVGHGTDVEHYEFTHPSPPGHKKPSIMANSPFGLHPTPKGYDDVDIDQMRLHRKHR
jgi:hypothetical protein